MTEHIAPACPVGHRDLPFGIVVRGVYDGVLLWECPSCGARWPRFSKGKKKRIALEIIKEWRKEAQDG